MQTSYQEYNTLGKSRPLVLNSPTTNDVRNTYLQPTLSSEVNQTEKISGENYNLKRVYSPYLSPSHLVVEQMTLNQNIAPVFVHNSARTKSFFVSKPAVPSDHNKINIYAWSIISNGLNSIEPNFKMNSLVFEFLSSQPSGMPVLFCCL